MLDPIQRNAIVAKRVATLLGALAAFMLLVLVVLFGPNVNSPLILGLAGFFFLVRVLIDRGYPNTGRVLLCIVPALVTLFAAVAAKLYAASFTDILYYDARFILGLLAIIPCLVFSLREPRKLYGTLAVCLAALMLFDPVHEFFNVGYFQKGFLSYSYYYINYVTLIAFLGISAGAIVLKRVTETAEEEANRANQKLSAAMNELALRNEAIVAQKEELSASQEKLLHANSIIESQKLELQKEVRQVNKDLEIANKELITRNNELSQFSYTISHNLRGPIARLLGLANLAELYKREGNYAEIEGLIDRMKSSAADLDTVISDLNLILELKNSIQLNKTVVDLDREWETIRNLINLEAQDLRESFLVDFSRARELMSFRPMINSILYNLVTNSIKYRSPERPLRVSVSSEPVDGYIMLQVADNGLGINLDRFHGDMFKLYKRFHTHQEGKGVGLYLVKAQAELLNGFVEVSSSLEAGSTFKVFIKSA